MRKHALIFGALGISGWAQCDTALTYPTPTTFDRVTGVANRPFSTHDANLPDDHRLCIVSGIDLTKDVTEVSEILKNRVKDIDTVTHVFLTAYSESEDPVIQKERNTMIVHNAVAAIDRLSSMLEHVILQTGGKWYGLEHVPHVPYPVPVRESFERIPPPYGDHIFYYSQWDTLELLRKEQTRKINGWLASDVRPDCIVGYSPGINFMNAAQGIGMYLILIKEVHGESADVPFPGTQSSWEAKWTDTSTDILAKTELYVALSHKNAQGLQHFNAADNSQATSWSEKWKDLCAYFGLTGRGPIPGRKEQFAAKGTPDDPMENFMKENEGAWRNLAMRHGLKSGEWVTRYSWNFLWWCMTHMDWDRQYDLGNIRQLGFEETNGLMEGYYKAFDRMGATKILPAQANSIF